MEKSFEFNGHKVDFNPEYNIGFKNKIIIAAFLKILIKVARPILVTVTAEIIKAIAGDKESAEEFIKEVLGEV